MVFKIMEEAPISQAILKMANDKFDLTERNAELEMFFDMSVDLLCVVKDDRWIKVSKSWEDCFGWTRQDFLDIPWPQLLHPGDHEATFAVVEQLKQGKVIRGFFNRLRRGKLTPTEYTWISWNCAYMQGKIYATGRVMRNPPEAPVLQWVADNQANRTFFNEAWLQFTGRALKDELGWGWLENVHPDDREKYRSEFMHCFNNRKPFEGNYRLMHRDKKYRVIHALAMPHYAADVFMGYVGASCDVSSLLL
jgi:PAS domain S-box-containing protein